MNTQNQPVRNPDRLNADAFSAFHPIVNFAYFVAVIGFSMFIMHPIFLAISLVCAAAYALYLSGKKAVRAGLKFALPMMLFTALLNPLFNHRGGTVLAFLPNGNPLTLESVVYGIAAAVMLVSVIAWFSCFNAVITSDKFVYLFGRVAPALALVIAMALRFVPRFLAQIKVISNAQKGLGREASGGVIEKARHGMKIMSIMVTWALENSIETADSMKGRGYGLPGRTAFSIFRFTRRDGCAMVYIAVCAAIIIAGAAMGAYRFRYFPTLQAEWTGSGFAFFVYFALAAFPLIVNLKEDVAWKFSESKV